jgi:hypothetical protein
MFYAAFRRMRSAAIIYLGVIAALALSAAVIVFIANGGQFKVLHLAGMHVTNASTTMSVQVGDGPNASRPAVAGHHARGPHVHGSLQMDRDLYALIVLGMAYGLAFLATAMGLSYAAENDGHLEFAWTRPITRERYALGILAVDLVGMLVAFVLSIAIAMLSVLACGGIELFAQSPVAPGDFGPALLALGFPLLIYAWVAALSASLRRGRAFAVLIWPAMFVLGIAEATIAPGSPFKPVVTALNVYLNPLQIFDQNEQHDLTLASASYGIASAAALMALTVGQWRRMEA